MLHLVDEGERARSREHQYEHPYPEHDAEGSAQWMGLLEDRVPEIVRPLIHSMDPVSTNEVLVVDVASRTHCQL